MIASDQTVRINRCVQWLEAQDDVNPRKFYRFASLNGLFGEYAVQLYMEQQRLRERKPVKSSLDNITNLG